MWSKSRYRNRSGCRNMLISAKGKQLVHEYHKKLKEVDEYGRSFHLKHKRMAVSKIFKDFNVKTVLDYGSGKCDWRTSEFANYESAVKFFELDNAYHYDPGLGIDQRKPVDCVVSFDVLEHILECDIPYCVEDMFRNAKKLIVCSVCTSESVHKLPNGDPCHITTYPAYWWKGVFDTIQTKYPGISYVLWVENVDDKPENNRCFESKRQ